LIMQCVKCGHDKPAADFYANDRTCKTCRCAMVRANRAARAEQYRAYEAERASQPHRRALNRSTAKAWREEHPEWRSAQTKVGNAIRDGRLQRWPCEICGAKAHAHHPHYDAPLVVTWLCPTHHKAAHRLLTDAATTSISHHQPKGNL
jgi:hypothetical protein